MWTGSVEPVRNVKKADLMCQLSPSPLPRYLTGAPHAGMLPGWSAAWAWGLDGAERHCRGVSRGAASQTAVRVPWNTGPGVAGAPAALAAAWTEDPGVEVPVWAGGAASHGAVGASAPPEPVITKSRARPRGRPAGLDAQKAPPPMSAHHATLDMRFRRRPLAGPIPCMGRAGLVEGRGLAGCCLSVSLGQKGDRGAGPLCDRSHHDPRHCRHRQRPRGGPPCRWRRPGA